MTTYTEQVLTKWKKRSERDIINSTVILCQLLFFINCYLHSFTQLWILLGWDTTNLTVFQKIASIGMFWEPVLLSCCYCPLYFTKHKGFSVWCSYDYESSPYLNHIKRQQNSNVAKSLLNIGGSFDKSWETHFLVFQMPVTSRIQTSNLFDW